MFELSRKPYLILVVFFALRKAACFCSSAVRGSGLFWLVTFHRNSGFFHIFSLFTRVLNEEILLLLRIRITLKRIGIRIRLFTLIRFRICAFNSDPDSTVHSDADLYQDRSFYAEIHIQRILYGSMASFQRSRIFNFMWIKIRLTPGFKGTVQRDGSGRK
jgi:hypothetical protein